MTRQAPSITGLNLRNLARYYSLTVRSKRPPSVVNHQNTARKAITILVKIFNQVNEIILICLFEDVIKLVI